MRQEYWQNPIETQTHFGVLFEFRASMAWELLKHFGSVAARDNGENSHGTTRVELQSPSDIVQRCFAIADAFLDTAEQRNEVRAAEPLELRAQKAGEIEHIKQNAAWGRSEEKKLVDSAAKQS